MAASTNTTVSFTNRLEKTNNTFVDISVSVTINQGQTSGTTTITENSLSYTDVLGTFSEFKDFSSTGELVDSYKVNSVTFIGKDSPIWQSYRFIACCKETTPQYVSGKIDSSALGSGGWVTNGNAIVYNGNCYIPFSVGTGGTDVGNLWGPRFSSCKDSYCICPTPTPTTTPTITTTPSITPSTSKPECVDLDCDVAVTPNPSVTPTQTPITPLSCDVAVTPNPSVTPTQTPITPLSCDVAVTPNPSVTPTQTPITPLSCDVNVT